MFEKEFILKECVSYERDLVMGVYFLINENEVLYIGSGIDVHHRIKNQLLNVILFL
jgi:hypothetical protein